MSTGDVTNPERVRFVSNERLDLVDADYLSQQDRLFIDALTRALLAAPGAASAAPVGLILTGGSITANPTGPSDGLLRVNSELFAALDADGRFLVKPTGTTISVAIPAGGAQHQIYLHFVDTKIKQAKRRAIPVTSPFTEFTITPHTRFQGNINISVRLGGLGTVIASDTIGGVTVPLVFLGLASNTAGVVTFSASTATNRIGTVVPPSSTPSSSSTGGSARTLHEVAIGGLYEVARTKFSGQAEASGAAANVVAGAPPDLTRVSGLTGMTAAMVGRYVTITGAATPDNNGTWRIMAFVNSTTVDVIIPFATVPDANNGTIAWSLFAHDMPFSSDPPGPDTNYGAYSVVRRGLDEVDRSSGGAITIGDGVSTFGTFDLSEFADHGACLQAAIWAAIGGGARVVLLAGTQLTDFSADVVVALAPSLVIEAEAGPGSASISLDSFKIDQQDDGLLTLRNLKITSFGTAVSAFDELEAYGCEFINVGTGGASVVATQATKLLFERCVFRDLSGSDDAAKVVAIDSPGPATLVRAVVSIDACTFVMAKARQCVRLDLNTGDDRSHAFVTRSTFEYPVDAGSDHADVAFLLLKNGSAVIDACHFRGSLTDAGRANFVAVQSEDSLGLLLQGCLFDHTFLGLYAAEGAAERAGRWTTQGCRFDVEGASNASSTRGIFSDAAPVDCYVEACSFDGGGFGVVTPQTVNYIVSGLSVRGCRFTNATFGVVAYSVSSVDGEGIVVEGNTFFSSEDGRLGPLVWMSSSAGTARCSWRGNRFYGYHASDSSNTYLVLKFIGQTIDVEVDGNRFEAIDFSVTYAGSTTSDANGGPNRMISFQGFTHRWKVSNNVGRLLGASSSGANFQQVTCIDVSTKARAVDAGSVLASCSIEGNDFGDEFSRCTFLQVGATDGTVGLQIASLKMAGNKHHSVPIAGSTSVAACGFLVTAESSAGTSRVFDVSNNEWKIENSATVGDDWFKLLATASMTFELFSFVHNAIMLVGGAFTSTFGMLISDDAIVVTVRNLVFRDNVSLVAGAGTSPTMWVTCANPTLSLPTSFAAGALGDNLRINRN